MNPEQLYLVWDAETFSECDLKKRGAYNYARHPSTRLLCISWRLGTMETLKTAKTKSYSSYLGGPDSFAEFKKAMLNPRVIKVAHNAMFEQLVARYVLNFENIPHSQWRCTAAQCRAHALPGKLEMACAALKLPFQKDMEGHRLMLKMSKPRRPTKNNSSTRHNKVSDLKRLMLYCARDVDAEVAIFTTVPQLSASEQRVWELDQVVNLRGFQLDRDLVDKALKLIPEEIEALKREMVIETGGYVDSPTQRDVLLDYLKVCCKLDLPDLQAQTLVDALKRDDLTKKTRRLLEIRQAVSKTSTAKYVAFKDRMADHDGRARDTQMYHVASTGRSGGSGINPLNLPRKMPDDPEFVIDAIKHHGLGFLRVLFGNPLSTLASCLKGCIQAGDGKVFFSGDFAAVEVRVLFWLACHEKGLKAYRENRKMYEEMATEIYGVELLDVTDDQRQIGKRAVLGAGFQMGWKRFVESCAEFGIITTDEIAQKAIAAYRRVNAPVVGLWSAVETAAINAVKNPGKRYRAGRCLWFKEGRYLYAQLPSGRRIAYVDPEIRWVRKVVEREDGTTFTISGNKLHYWGIDSYTKKWKREATFGGKIAENITQATARDIMVGAQRRLEDAKFETVLTVYDSVLSEGDDSRSEQEFSEIMSISPKWASDLPLKVDVWKNKRMIK